MEHTYAPVLNLKASQYDRVVAKRYLIKSNNNNNNNEWLDWVVDISNFVSGFTKATNLLCLFVLHYNVDSSE